MSRIRMFLIDVVFILRASLRGVLSVVRTQLILSAVNFILLCIGLALIGIPWWGLVSLLITLFDLIPVVGSGMVMIPWALVRFIMGATNEGFQLLIVYAVIFVTRQVLEPVINGRVIGVKPLYTMMSTLIFTLLLGPWGLLLGTVFAVIIKSILEIRDNRRQALQDRPNKQSQK